MQRFSLVIVLVAFGCSTADDNAPGQTGEPVARDANLDREPQRDAFVRPPMDAEPDAAVEPDGDPPDAAPPPPDAAPLNPACGDGVDNDGDGRIDLLDPGCTARDDNDETDPPPCGGRALIDLNAIVADGSLAEGTTTGADEGWAGSCGGLAGGEVVFTYTVESVADAIVFRTDYDETTSPTVLYIRPACEAREDLACNRGSVALPGTRVRFEPPAPGLYYVVVDTGARDGGGAFRLGAEVNPLPQCRNGQDDDRDGRIDDFDPGCADGDDDDELDPDPVPRCADGIDNDDDMLIDYPDDPDCDRASSDSETPLRCNMGEVIVLPPEGGQVAVDTNGGADNYQGGCGGSGPERVVAIYVPGPSDIVFETTGANFDTLIWVRRDCDDGNTQVGCDDDGGDGTQSRLQLNNAEAGAYYFFVDGFGGRAGQTTARVTVTPR